MRNIIKIAYYDDEINSRIEVKALLTELNDEFKKHGNLDFEIVERENYLEVLNDIESGMGDYALLILDMYEKSSEEDVGKLILGAISSKKTKIPTIIFTGRVGKKAGINYQILYDKYDFILGERIVKDQPVKLEHRIKKFIIKEYMSDDFLLIDNDDILLQAEILMIGKDNLKSILYQYKIDNKIEKITVERLSSGFSGAAVFRLKYNNKISICKISKDKPKLKEEHNYAESLYRLFPAHLINTINPNSYETEDVLAFFMSEVQHSISLYSWLKETREKDTVSLFFNNLFLDTSLGVHYQKVDSKVGSRKFDYIFKSYKFPKFSLVKKVFNQINPIIENFSEFNFSLDDVENMVLNERYKHIRLDGLKEKHLVLCHGDLHAKNIMVQGNMHRAILIDTGGVKYDYWCMDVCRLIVNIFIEGMDEGTYNFFSHEVIKDNLELAKIIINMTDIDPDGNNDGFIYAINWLTQNAPNIYGDLFLKWEFQLGLMKEFLNHAYWSSSNSKKVLSLLSAYECLIQANKEKIDWDKEQKNGE